MEPIITEKRSYLGLLLGIFAVILIIIISFFLYQYVMQPAPEATPFTLESYGLSAPLDPDATPFGTMLYTKYTEATPEVNSLPYIYQYNFETDTEDLLSSQSFTEAVALSATTTLVIKDNTIALYDRATETLTTLPHQPNSVLSDLTISPDQTRYAYSYREPDIADPDNPGAYAIAVHTFGSEGVEIIAEGAKPKWLAESLIYMTTTSLNQYNFETKEIRRVYYLYSPYSMKDDIAISYDFSSAILTIATSSLISVIAVESDKQTNLTESNITMASSSTFFTLIRATPPTRLIELGRIITPGTIYKNPIFTADSSFYVLESKTEDPITVLELRAFNSSKIITKIEVK